MKINVTQKVYGYDKKAMLDADGRKDIILRQLIYMALNSPIANKNKNTDEMYKVGLLNAEIMLNKEIDMRVEDIALIKAAMGGVFKVPEIIWAVNNIIDPPEKEKKLKEVRKK